MEKSLPIKERFEVVMKRSFPELTFYHHIEEMKGQINVFFIELADEKTLGELWEKIRNVIAVYYQNHLETDFELWNIYIIFVLPVAVSNELKYKIENDQLSSRKIVVDNFEQKMDDKTRGVLLSTYINNDLFLPQTSGDTQKRSTEYTSDSKVFSVINAPGKNNKGKNQLQFLYTNLLNKLKNEDTEG
ncbi:ABC-three component system middle component 1 [Roseivirga sp. BDSF3-8]|uniref:ABC-three component system middle component 1 n=1 Tax=Roseivirga sp. BDSF3-8 TaxID=3241598 RepID=UPI003531F475